jgi:hypothetical protein
MGIYTNIVKHEKEISVCFFIEGEKVLGIGEKVNEINEDAYMNGYNWEALLNHYLPKYYPDVFENMETDPEAGMYVAVYELTKENEQKAEKLAQILDNLIENEEKLYEFVKNEGENIEWD